MNLFEKDDDNKIDIPDFVEEKDDDSTSVDMSIFKMSDEELYDDVKVKDEKEPKVHKKKSNSTILLCLVVIGILLVTSVVSIIYALKEHNSISAVQEQLTQAQAQNTDYVNQINTLNGQVADLNKKIEEMKNAGTTSDPNNKYSKGTLLYITEDGHTQGVRVKASKDSDYATNADGSSVVLYWGDEVTLTADATIDENGVYWGQYDKGFFRIEVGEEVWASTEKNW